MILEKGQYLQNRYEILSLIGTGGMSEVYMAHCHVLNRNVAIKVLREEFCQDESFVSKFKNEARSAARLTHPNIVGIYDVVDEDRLHYIVMELVKGVTLKQYIRQKGHLAPGETIGIALQVAQGIAAAHDQNIIHRDIKPQNIIVNQDGRVKVADFGIARAVTEQTQDKAHAVGSVHYISPEQARGGTADGRSDIYSLGVTMYEMITGVTPFEGDTPVAVALAHLQQKITPPEHLNQQVPDSLSRIIMICTSKKPEDRYQDAHALIADLRRALGEDVQPPSGTGEQVRRRGRHGRSMTDRLLAGLAMLSALLVVAIIGVIMSRLSGIFNLGSRGETVAESSIPESDAGVQETEGTEESAENVINLQDMDLIGMDAMKASELLSDYELTVITEEAFSEDVPQGKVIRVSPDRPAVGDKVTLTVSKGAETAMVTVPKIVGLTEDEAVNVLETLGLTLGKSTEKVNANVPEGQILEQSTAPQTQVPAGSAIDYVVSSGRDSYYAAAVDDVISLQDYLGPSAGDTTLLITIVLKQVVNGEMTTKVIMDATDFTGDTALPVHYPNIEGAYGVRDGNLEVRDLTNNRILRNYKLSFVEVDR